MSQPWEGVVLAVPVPVRVRINRIGPKRQRCPSCGRRRVVYCLQAAADQGPDTLGLFMPTTSEHRCAACWGIRENTR